MQVITLAEQANSKFLNTSLETWKETENSRYHLSFYLEIACFQFTLRLFFSYAFLFQTLSSKKKEANEFLGEKKSF